jgi:hypothetical protein
MPDFDLMRFYKLKIILLIFGPMYLLMTTGQMLMFQQFILEAGTTVFLEVFLMVTMVINILRDLVRRVIQN